jgi:hypothetical protein
MNRLPERRRDPRLSRWLVGTWLAASWALFGWMLWGGALT